MDIIDDEELNTITYLSVFIRKMCLKCNLREPFFYPEAFDSNLISGIAKSRRVPSIEKYTALFLLLNRMFTVIISTCHDGITLILPF